MRRSLCGWPTQWLPSFPTCATHPVALYLDFGVLIKARSKAVQTLTVQTADGHYRYLPTARALAAGGYGSVPESIVSFNSRRQLSTSPAGTTSRARVSSPRDASSRRIIAISSVLPSPTPSAIRNRRGDELAIR